jgi:hypothetical protein
VYKRQVLDNADQPLTSQSWLASLPQHLKKSSP